MGRTWGNRGNRTESKPTLPRATEEITERLVEWEALSGDPIKKNPR